MPNVAEFQRLTGDNDMAGAADVFNAHLKHSALTVEHHAITSAFVQWGLTQAKEGLTRMRADAIKRLFALRLGLGRSSSRQPLVAIANRAVGAARKRLGYPGPLLTQLPDETHDLIVLVLRPGLGISLVFRRLRQLGLL